MGVCNPPPNAPRPWFDMLRQFSHEVQVTPGGTMRVSSNVPAYQFSNSSGAIPPLSLARETTRSVMPPFGNCGLEYGAFKPTGPGA
jgi:hypothetical protein